MVSKRKPHFPQHYVWLVLLSSMDVFLTWIILYYGGREVNPVAATVMGLHPKGLVVFKFVLVAVVVGVCEVVGDRNRAMGERLAVWACALTCVPLVVATVQLLGRG